MKKNLQTLMLSIVAGVSISLGGLIYLLSSNNVIGALFFTTGLFLVLTRNYNLFTGKVAYAIDNKPKFILQLFIIWIGNFIGSFIFAITIRNTYIYNKIFEKVIKTNETKLSQGYISAFLLAVLCGIIIFLAVENFKENPHIIGKYMGLLLLIPLFIICGFEHCVADMFYFLLDNNNVFEKCLYLFIITAGNSTGSILANFIKKQKG